MEKMQRKNLIISLVMNLVIAVFVLVGVIISYGKHGIGCLQFYTVDSNLILAISCIAMAINEVVCLSRKNAKIAQAITTFKYISVCLVAVTFLVVAFLLAPGTGSFAGYVQIMFYDSKLFHHFLCPILGFVSFIFFETDNDVSLSDAFFALIPTIVYAIVAVVLNVVYVIDGPYPFLQVTEQPVYISAIWGVAIIGSAYLFAWAIYKLRNLYKKKMLIKGRQEKQQKDEEKSEKIVKKGRKNENINKG